MGAQVYIAKPTAEEIADKQRKEAERAATWRVQTMLRSAMPSGGNGPILDWSRMPTWR